MISTDDMLCKFSDTEYDVMLRYDHCIERFDKLHRYDSYTELFDRYLFSIMIISMH